MADYIERAAVVELFNKWADGYSYIEVPTENAIACVRVIPAADVRPVVRGKWKDAMQSCNDSPHVKCSVCGEYYWRYFKKFNFCPNCGADMREEQDGR